MQERGLIPGSGRSPKEENGNVLLFFPLSTWYISLLGFPKKKKKKHHRLGILNNRKLFSTVLEAAKSKIKVPANSVRAETLFLAYR